MTPQQSKALNFIKGYIKAYSYSPSYREIANGMGLKSSSVGYVHNLVHSLEQEGYINMRHGKQRTISMTGKNILGELEKEI